jgi:hypothetical protein
MQRKSKRVVLGTGWEPGYEGSLNTESALGYEIHVSFWKQPVNKKSKQYRLVLERIEPIKRRPK